MEAADAIKGAELVARIKDLDLTIERANTMVGIKMVITGGNLENVRLTDGELSFIKTRIITKMEELKTALETELEEL